MTLRFEDVRIPLAEFELFLDLALDGPVTAIIGPSGAGKTSLLELVAGLRAPSKGRVRLDGETLEDEGARLRVPPRARGIGYLTQDDTLFPHLSVEGNLVYGARDEHREKREAVVSALGLPPLLSRSPAKLSGGERRRVALGRALIAASRLLLLDEPLTGLNAELREAVSALLLDVKARWKTPMLYVTHVPDEAHALADEVVELREGAVVRAGRSR